MVLPFFGINQLPYWMGVMVFVGILGASMSTANGAMLVISVVLSRNVFERWSKKKYEDSFMLTLSRVMALPTAAVAAAGRVAPSRTGHSAGCGVRHRVRRLRGAAVLWACTGRRQTAPARLLRSRRERSHGWSPILLPRPSGLDWIR